MRCQTWRSPVLRGFIAHHPRTARLCYMNTKATKILLQCFTVFTAAGAPTHFRPPHRTCAHAPNPMDKHRLSHRDRSWNVATPWEAWRTARKALRSTSVASSEARIDRRRPVTRVKKKVSPGTMERLYCMGSVGLRCAHPTYWNSSALTK